MTPVLRKVATWATVLAAALFGVTLFVQDAPEPVRVPFVLHAAAATQLQWMADGVDGLDLGVELPRNDVVRLTQGFVFGWSVRANGRVVASDMHAEPQAEILSSRSSRTLRLATTAVQAGQTYEVEVHVVQLPDGADGLQAALRVAPDASTLKGGAWLAQWLFQLMTVSIVVAGIASLLSRRPPRRAPQ